MTRLAEIQKSFRVSIYSEQVFEAIEELLSSDYFSASEANAGHEGFPVNRIMSNGQCFSSSPKDYFLVGNQPWQSQRMNPDSMYF